MTITTERLRAAAASLGPLPTSLHRLLAITASPEFDFDEIVDVVDHDMMLTAAILRRANSASSSPADRIDSVRESIVRIGAVQALATAMHSVVGGTMQRDLRRYDLSAETMWSHSCAASIAATHVRLRSAVPLPTSTGTTGLLHDIGKVVLDSLAPDDQAPAIVEHGAEACALEEQRYGLDHAAMGGLVAEAWNLPPAIVEGIAGHHELVDDPLPSAICLADTVAHMVWNEPVSFPLIAAADSARLILGIDDDAFDRIVAATAVEVADLLDRFTPLASASPASGTRQGPA
ncbi:MAG: HDOD domain-containing protein [Acidimicrobiales bacterium]